MFTKVPPEDTVFLVFFSPHTIILSSRIGSSLKKVFSREWLYDGNSQAKTSASNSMLQKLWTSYVY